MKFNRHFIVTEMRLRNQHWWRIYAAITTVLFSSKHGIMKDSTRRVAMPVRYPVSYGIPDPLSDLDLEPSPDRTYDS